MSERVDVAIAGGGLAGLSMAILLARKGFQVEVLERGEYPRRKVCGEYISRESEGFLQALGVPLARLAPPQLSRFTLTTPFGHSATCRLRPGGIGISRFRLDALLAELAGREGVRIRTGCAVRGIAWDAGSGEWRVDWKCGAGARTGAGAEVEPGVEPGDGTLLARVALGAYGRAAPPAGSVAKGGRSAVGGQTAPRFIGVKTHVERGPADDTIEIHHFRGGYAGISKVEDGSWCLCYLADARELRPFGNDFDAFEAHVLSQNPFLRARLSAGRLHERVTTSRIEFGLAPRAGLPSGAPSLPLLGDASGFIPPITGNGMSLAFRSAAALHGPVCRMLEGQAPPESLERACRAWRDGYLRRRIGNGVRLQNLLFESGPSRYRLLMAGLTRIPGLLSWLSRLAVGREIRLGVLAAALSWAGVACSPNSPAADEPWGEVTVFRSGGPGVQRDVSPGICLMGGGAEVDQAMRWFLQRAGGGDVVVLRASGSDGYQRYLHLELGVPVHSVTTLRFDGPRVGEAALGILDGAEAIWIAGGDQERYLDLWLGGPVQDALQRAVDRGVPIGGTSAGMAVLGEHIWDGERLRTGFLRIPLLRDVITDTHVDTRSRESRHAQWVRALQARAIAADEQAAVCVDADPRSPEHGLALVFSPPDRPTRVQFLHLQEGSDQVVRVQVTGNAPGAVRFDLSSWRPLP